jgi:capsular exopolysaccharide synthesis family protein
MTASNYGRVLLRHWMLVVAAVLVALAAAAAATLLAPRTYEASAQLLVAASAETNGSGLFSGSQFAQQQVKSYAQIVNSPLVTGPVIKALGLSETPNRLGARISADVPEGTAVLNLHVEGNSADGAAQIANAVAEQLVEFATRLEQPEGATTAPVKVTVVRPAVAPDVPASPRPLSNLALALVLGSGVGVALALLRDRWTGGIDSREDVQAVLDLPVFGAIPFASDAQRYPLPAGGGHFSPHAEAFRQLRASLKYAEVSHGLKSILVTSADPGEGKSSTVVNLAATLAKTGVKVVVVEANLRRPRLGDLLGIDAPSGLSDILTGSAVLEEEMHDWGPTGRMHVVLSGPVPPNPGELLDSPQMARLVRLLESRADVVLIDAPPVLPVADAVTLSRIAGGALLVVRAGRTRRDAVVQAVDLLRSVSARVLGVVLNQIPPTRISQSYAPEVAPRGESASVLGPQLSLPLIADDWDGRHSASSPMLPAATPAPPMEDASGNGSPGAANGRAPQRPIASEVGDSVKQ